jgi:hypothetical protein
MAETLARDWRKAAWFYARFGVTEGQVRYGVPSEKEMSNDDPSVDSERAWFEVSQ